MSTAQEFVRSDVQLLDSTYPYADPNDPTAKRAHIKIGQAHFFVTEETRNPNVELGTDGYGESYDPIPQTRVTWTDQHGHTTVPDSLIGQTLVTIPKRDYEAALTALLAKLNSVPITAPEEAVEGTEKVGDTEVEGNPISPEDIHEDTGAEPTTQGEPGDAVPAEVDG